MWAWSMASCLWKGGRAALVGAVRRHSTGPVMPTTLNRLEAVEAAPVISSYSVQGFTIRGNRLIGSVALLPRGVFSWKVCSPVMQELVMSSVTLQMKSPADITPESFTMFTLTEPKLGIYIHTHYMYMQIMMCVFMCAIELLVIGTGETLVMLPPSVRAWLQARGVSVEVQDTVSWLITLL